VVQVVEALHHKWVRFPVGLLEFFIDMILTAAQWPWGRLSPEQKWVPGGGKGGQCIGLTTLPPSCADCLEILGASTSCSPKVCTGIAVPLSEVHSTSWAHLAFSSLGIRFHSLGGKSSTKIKNVWWILPPSPSMCVVSSDTTLFCSKAAFHVVLLTVRCWKRSFKTSESLSGIADGLLGG